ncbi:FG-GAP-like repeat-containing protein [Streptomyces sp. NPDC058664]|uniref:FG-GAP-like repeat-containing protein n=1 Tax=unclassified Streptomyces TaxID=2593676 RepID=UPI0036494498
MSVRRAVALALSAALGITGLTALTTTPAVASGAPYDVTVAAPPSIAPPPQSLFGAGTGLQTIDPAVGLRWQSLSDGRVASRDACDSIDMILFHGDRFGCVGPYGDWDASVHDWTTGTTLTRTRPEGHTWLRAFGTDRLLSFSTDSEGAVTLHLPGLGEGAPADAAVTTAERIIGHPKVLAFDTEGAVVSYTRADAVRAAGLVDFATGVLVPLPTGPDLPTYLKAALSDDHVVVYSEYGEMAMEALVVPRATPAGPGTTVKLPNDAYSNDARLGLVGDWIVGHYGDRYTPHPLKATSLTSGATRDLGVSAAADAELKAGSDGALYVVGGTDSTHWGVRRVTLDAAGVPVTAQVLSTPPQPIRRTGLSMANGRITAEHEDAHRTLQGYDLSLTEPRTATPVWSCAVTSAGTSGTSPCADPVGPQPVGFRWTDTGDGRLVALGADDLPPSRGNPPCSSCAPTVYVATTGFGSTTRKITLDTTRQLKPSHFLDVAGRYVRFRATENSASRSVVADIETGKVLSVSEARNQALWGTWLWTASTANDTVTAVDLRTGATVATVDLGTDCGTFDFDVVGKWIYARCGDNTSAVVYDREKKTSVRFQLSRYARPQLGDGFLAHTETGSGSDGDSLSVTDVRSGAPVTRTLGTLAPGVTNYGQNWTIDRFGGAVAFIDSRQAIRVVGLGGVTSRVTALDAAVPTSVNLKSATWKPRWTLSKPGTWSLALKNKATGRTVRTLTGVGRGTVAPAWDGKDATGRFVANGAHTWTLAVKPADGQGADLAVSGALSVSGGEAVRRDLAGDDGFGDLLVMDTAGLVSMYRGTGTGAVSARIAGTGTKFATTSAFVPAGDLNGDRCADVYARVGDQLRAYRPGCGKVVSASSPYTLVGSGWGQYDVLTSPGDVNGDGYADLVVRQASTGDMYFYGGTADHRVKARVKIGSNWKPYKRIVGAGDLNGDGRGDLLGVDAAGVLWRYHGTATGGVTARVKVGAGWGGYSSLVGVGDLSGDGRADLVARDTAGKLWRYSGTGTGAYGTRALIGASGWNTFKGLY